MVPPEPRGRLQLNLPNALSLARLPLAAAFVFAESPLIRALLIFTAGLTDFIDGWCARHFGQRSRAGELLDPVTDKLFVFTVLLTLYLRKELLGWELLVLLLRDIYNTFMFAIAKIKRMQMRFAARMSGKVVTFLQVATVLAIILVPALARLLLLATGLAALYSIVDYTRAGLLALRKESQPR